VTKQSAPKAKRQPPPTSPKRPPADRAAAGRGRAPQQLRPEQLVGLLAAVVYLNGIAGGFVFDDKLIQRDPRILGQTSFWTIFVTDYWYTYIGTSADLYRPLTIASYALTFAVAGLSSAAFHLVNILLHAVVCGLLVALIDALLEDRSLAVVAGVLFAVHPIHTEAVTGIVGRAEILTALFLVVALYLHARSYSLGGMPRAGWIALALLSYFCALASKETAIVGPGLLLLVDYLKPNAGTVRGGRWELRRCLGVGLLYLGVVALYMLVRFAVLGRFIQKPPPHSYLLLFGQPLMPRLYTAREILATYMRLLFFPVTLSADYSYRAVPILDTPNVATFVGLLAAVGLAGAFVWAVRRRVRPVVLAVGLFAIAYSVAANFPVPLQVLVAERLMYLPSVGFCVGLAWLWTVLSRWCTGRVPAGWLRHVPEVVVGTVVLLYGARTFTRNFDWYNNETLYAATVQSTPECFAAHFNYAAILMADPNKHRLALDELLRAYEIRQDHYPSLVNLTSVYMSLGQPEKARAYALLGLKVQPNGRELRRLLDAIEAKQGHGEEG
jgi:hypothetical protein